jgi:hypothetical protein
VLRTNTSIPTNDSADLQAALDRGGGVPVDEVVSLDTTDLGRLTNVDVEKDGKRFRIRSTTQGCAGKALQATGGAVPPTVNRFPQRAGS